MANVMSMKNLRNKVSRNGFDMSERRSFTAKVGEILPCFVLEVIPGDSVQLHPEHFTRTMPVNTAAYTQIKEQISYYFVPYRLLHAGFDAFFMDMKENPTRAQSIKKAMAVTDKLPYLTVSGIGEYITECNKKQCVNAVGMAHAQHVVKLLEYLGYGDFSSYLKSGSPIPVREDLRLSPLTLLAYQKIYQDHFRNKIWEKPSPETSNIDYQPFGTQIDVKQLLSATYSQKQLVNDLFSLRYTDFQKDYFFGVMPNAQYGDSVLIPGYTGTVDFDPSRAGKDIQDAVGYNTTFGTLKDMFGIGKHNVSASIVALRKAEALQKYREIKQSGNQTYKSHLEKIFNVFVSDERSDECRFLGGYDSSINISEVVNTSLNGEDSEATIKGKGISGGNGTSINFESKEFGVIIGIYMSRPVLDYALSAPMKANTRVSLDDFANPVFDRIGMETIDITEIASVTDLSLLAGERVKLAPIGYAPRYISYKSSYDKVLGEFKRTLSSWVAPLSSKTIFNNMIKELDPLHIHEEIGTLEKYSLSYRSFKVSPASVNSIFTTQVDNSELGNSTATDQLLIKVGTSCPIVRNLDYDGLPY